ncbi:MAG: InlB B-repeat-containing protein, partial [Rikenellaceae bacterium]|nr:InlB B-repeat-containing protein [Rikenellaceae bacterium]
MKTRILFIVTSVLLIAGGVCGQDYMYAGVRKDMVHGGTVTNVAPAAQSPVVKFDTGGGGKVASQSVSAGDKVKVPARPTKAGWVFVGWYTDQTADLDMWDFLNDTVSETMTLYAKWVQVDETHRLLNAYASAEELKNPYVAATLQTLGELSADQRTLTLPAGTTVYVAPGVYWTDLTYRQGFPFDNSGFVIPGPNIGLSILGANLSFIGLTADAKDAHICGNRGEGGAKGLGASGSWYALALSTGFHGENITIANYAQEDLVYPRDPSQNISKRIKSTNHAEVLRPAEAGIDKMYFENVRFIGFLNMMAGFSPARAYFKECTLQCTDDAIFGGNINVYEKCTFYLYDNHPSAGGASAGGINALLGCKLIGMPQMTYASLHFTKISRGNGADASSIFALIDNEFLGRIETVEWENVVREDARQAVSNNTIGENRRPLVISSAQPQVSVTYAGAALNAFKVGNEYNVYNLLKGTDGWDPKGQNTA